MNMEKEYICGKLTSLNIPTQETADSVNCFLEETRKIKKGESDD